MNRIKKGFTMIELLIVVSVLGILAVAVLAAINPIEQINRGKDTGSRSDAEQLLSAIDRFYTQGYYPWQYSADDDTHVAITPITKIIAVDTIHDFNPVGNVGLLTKLSTGGTAEIKASFVSRLTTTSYNYLWLYNRGTQGDSTYVCFYPKSGSFKTEAQNRCTAGLPPDLNTQVGVVCLGGVSPIAYMICLP